MIEALLIISTLLGGAAAVWYFWDIFGQHESFDRSFGRLEPPTPIDSSSVFAYGNGSKRLWALTNRIANTRGFEIENVDGESAWLNERIKKFGVQTIRELDSYVQEYGEAAVKLTNYVTPQKAIDNWFVLQAVLDIAAIEKRGLEGIRELHRDLKYSTGGERWAEDVFKNYVQIKKHK
jgi:hypothetical protein